MNKHISPCQYFPTCGGCQYLDLETSQYHKSKSEALIEFFKGNLLDFKINFLWIEPPSRRKITLHSNKDNQLGFYKSSSREIIAIDKCYVAHEKINDIIDDLHKLTRSIPTGKISKVQITAFDDSADLLFYFNKSLTIKEESRVVDFAIKRKVNISSIYKKDFSIIYQEKKNVLNLKNRVSLELDSNIFIQASKRGLNEIISQIESFITQDSPKAISVIDLYSGFGVYGFAIHDKVRQLSLYEGSADMVDAVKRNIKKNHIATNMKVNQQDLYNFPVSHQELKSFDLAIINPPRNGASSQIKEIVKSQLKNLIYVSCNPKTFTRDFSILQGHGFKINKITAIDQFYSTDHFEIVAIIQR